MMKHYLKQVISIIVVLICVSGCSSSMKKLDMYVADSNGKLRTAYVDSTTVADSMNSAFTIYSMGLETDEVDEQTGKKKVQQVSSETWMGERLIAQTVKILSSNVPVAIVQGKYGKDIARIHGQTGVEIAEIRADSIRCPIGTEFCHSNVSVDNSMVLAQGGTAEGSLVTSKSQSLSESEAKIDVRHDSFTPPPPLKD